MEDTQDKKVTATVKKPKVESSQVKFLQGELDAVTRRMEIIAARKEQVEEELSNVTLIKEAINGKLNSLK